jgi:phosphoribosylamine--glycine ligase
MIMADGTPKVIEYNCRFGDPETQPIMLRLKSSLVELCNAALDKRLDQVEAEWDARPSVGVVMAAGGYPGSYAKGDEISLPADCPADSKIFHAGTKLVDGKVVTAGGRVLCVTALGDSVTDAQQRAYALVDQVSWKDAYYRTDIAYRAIAREKAD